MRYINYSQWVKEYPETHGEAGMELLTAECPECDGDGYIECNCCGNETSCDCCDGTGKVQAETWDADDALHSPTFRRMYQSELIDDVVKYCRWRPSSDLLMLAGDAITHINREFGKRQ